MSKCLGTTGGAKELVRLNLVPKGLISVSPHLVHQRIKSYSQYMEKVKNPPKNRDLSTLGLSRRGEKDI